MNEDFVQLERWHLEATIEEKKPDVAFLLKPKHYPEPLKLPNSPMIKIHGAIQEEMAPIAKLIKDYEDQDFAYRSNAEKNLRLSIDIANRESYLRKIIQRVLDALSNEDLPELLNARLPSGSTVKGALAKNCLLPDKHQESTKLWKADVAHELGSLTNLPLEIRRLIFQELNINEARKVVTVSKSWFKELTAREVWRSKSTSLNPYLSLIRKEFYSKFMKRKHVAYSEEIDVVDGEGMLVCEAGFVQAVKLNGKPLAAVWSDIGGSVGRCMVRSRKLDRDEIDSMVKNIESYLNEGDLDLSRLTETIGSFMKCMANGRYTIEVCCRQIDVEEFNSTDELDELVSTYAFDQTIYCTQPSDLLNDERVAYYEQIINQGKRPALLLLCSLDSFLIDGHHKLQAYSKLHLLHEAVLINILPHNPKERLTREAELAYIEHSPNAVENYNECYDHFMS